MSPNYSLLPFSGNHSGISDMHQIAPRKTDIELKTLKITLLERDKHLPSFHSREALEVARHGKQKHWDLDAEEDGAEGQGSNKTMGWGNGWPVKDVFLFVFVFSFIKATDLVKWLRIFKSS